MLTFVTNLITFTHFNLLILGEVFNQKEIRVLIFSNLKIQI